jgi:hypothetical protein
MQIRVLVLSDAKMLLEAQILEDVAATIRSPDTLLQILVENFPRSILQPSTLAFLRDLDELVLSIKVDLPPLEEGPLLEQLETFLEDARDYKKRIQALLNPAGNLPANPFNR